MDKEHDVRVFELAIRSNLLPTKLEELVPLSFVGQTAVSFYREKMALMKKLDMAEEQKQATLRDGQDAGKMLLAIEARIGELIPKSGENLKTYPREKGHIVKPSTRSHPHVTPGEKLSRQQRDTASAIARYPEAVKEVIKEAEENEDIPTKTAVLNKIRLNRERQRRKEAPPKSEIEITLEQAQYINTLERIINLLPQEPPKHWNEEAFGQAKGLALIIINRLGVFNNGKITKNITD